MRMDFEVTDSIGKLERLGLLHTVAAEAGEKLLQVRGAWGAEAGWGEPFIWRTGGYLPKPTGGGMGCSWVEVNAILHALAGGAHGNSVRAKPQWRWVFWG